MIRTLDGQMEARSVPTMDAAGGHEPPEPLMAIRKEDAGMQTEVPQQGDVFIHRRTFTAEEVRAFGELTGDQQAIHTEPDDDGRLVLQGLLTGSLMTKIGGDLNYIARTMEYEFRRPVYTDQTITCEWTVESMDEHADRYLLENSAVYHNEADERVIEAKTTGLIWK